MLKWLVTKSSNPLDPVVTDDPLATLGRQRHKHDPIYAVSRVNPIFEEEGRLAAKLQHEDKISNLEAVDSGLPDSGSNDRESVRSSGYSSKEADSVSFKSDSQEDENVFEEIIEDGDNTGPILIEDHLDEALDDSEGFSNEHMDSIKEVLAKGAASDPLASETNSESKGIEANPNFVKSIEFCSSRSSNLECIYESSPELERKDAVDPNLSSRLRSNISEALQRQNERIHQRRERERLKFVANQNKNRTQNLRFNPLVSIIAQNKKFVASISVSPINDESKNESKNESEIEPDSLNSNHERDVSLREDGFQIGSIVQHSNRFSRKEDLINYSYPLVSLQPDSLINEDTLQMMNYSGHTTSNTQEPIVISTGQNIPASDLPDFGKALYSNRFSSLKVNSTGSHEYLDDSKRNLSCSRVCAKKKGVSVIKDLWEKTGLKTNGRKLLVDFNDLITEENEVSNSTESSQQNLSIFERRRYGGSQMRKSGSIQTISGRGSALSEPLSHHRHFSSFPRISPSTGFERRTKSENLNFLNSQGVSGGLSTFSKFHPFQHNLSDFPRKVSERIEAEQNNSWLDYRLNGFSGSSRDVSGTEKVFRDDHSKNSIRPGKAVRKFGLERSWKDHLNKEYSTNPNGGSTDVPEYNLNISNLHSYDRQNQGRSREKLRGHYREKSLSGHFFPHPNSGAPMFESKGGFSYDFTVDPRRSQRMLYKSTRSSRQKRCCLIAIIFLAFAAFIGTIVGMSWYSTGGQKFFGSM